MIFSMTGYARCSDQGDWGMATWEIRSVNNRYFDCSLKMPEFLRGLESIIRPKIQTTLQRGRIECFLKYQPGESINSIFKLNTSVINRLAEVINQVKKSFSDAVNLDVMKILSWPEVIQGGSETSGLLNDKILQLFDQSLAEIVASREREGAALQIFISEKLEQIIKLSAQIKPKIPAALLAQKSKLIKHLADIKTEFDPLRLEQELVYYTQKIDISEELERLETHVIELKRIIKAGGSIGKRLDFLLQELNRETNTIASKSVDAEITKIAVELKVIIEQIREQIQNLL